MQIFLRGMLILAIVANGFLATAQTTKNKCAKLVFNSSQLKDTDCDTSIKRVRTGTDEKIVVKLKNGTKYHVPADSVWGIRKRDGTVLRWFNGQWYMVAEEAPIISYQVSYGRHTSRYFSTAFDSDIFPYTDGQLKKHVDSSTLVRIRQENERTRHEIGFGAYATRISILNDELWGGGFEFKYRIKGKWRTGFQLSYTGKRTSDSFSLPARSPLLGYLEIGWLNELTVVTGKTFNAGIGLVNGIGYAELRDRSQTEIKNRREVTKKVVSTTLYQLQPNASLSVRLSGPKQLPGVYLNTVAGYRFLFGNRTFGDTRIGPSFSMLAGISIVGFDR